MSRYEIAFSGELAPGATLEQVQINLTRLFQADAQRIALLFSGRRIVIKQGLDYDSVEKYRQPKPQPLQQHASPAQPPHHSRLLPGTNTWPPSSMSKRLISVSLRLAQIFRTTAPLPRLRRWTYPSSAWLRWAAI